MSVPPALPGWPHPRSPFHEGELAIQDRLGIRGRIDRQSRRGIRDFMPDQHRDFFRQLPFILVGTTDGSGQPWASLLVGPPGFVTAPDPRILAINADCLPGDPLRDTLKAGIDIGVLGIELPTRRRNRMNGIVTEAGPDGFRIAVAQSFGNCPQYIQARDVGRPADPDPPSSPTIHDSAGLDARARAIIAAADTFFIASACQATEIAAARGVDVSHRGGKAGFVRIDDDRTLTSPDFVGNFFFNTLGNLLLDPRAGLLFVDFAGGDLLYLAVDAEIIWDGPEVAAFAGAERLVRFHIRGLRRVEGGLPLRWSKPEYSSLLARTGSWDDVAKALDAERVRNLWRPFIVTEVQQESPPIRSIRLAPGDGGGISPHAAGQFLPIRVTLPGDPAPTQRLYTLSDAANGRDFRISVKRQGAVSAFLHDRIEIGSQIEILAPRGGFVFDHASRRPAVLISAGVGITPMIAMLNSLLVNDGRTRHPNRIFFLHAARNGREQAFAGHLRDKAARHANLTLHIRYSAPSAADILGVSHDSVGRLNIDLLKAVLPFDDFDFYLCGPGGLMQSLYDGLRALNVPDHRIRFEAFGPATVRKTAPGPPPPSPTPPPPPTDTPPPGNDDEAIQVVFARAGRTVPWRPADGSLLDLAEAQGLTPPFSCRAGLCGRCVTAVLAGSVDYPEPPGAPISPGEALICCATPHPGPHLDDGADREGITLDL